MRGSEGGVNEGKEESMTNSQVAGNDISTQANSSAMKLLHRYVHPHS